MSRCPEPQAQCIEALLATRSEQKELLEAIRKAASDTAPALQVAL